MANQTSILIEFSDYRSRLIEMLLRNLYIESVVMVFSLFQGVKFKKIGYIDP